MKTPHVSKSLETWTDQLLTSANGDDRLQAVPNMCAGNEQ